MGMDTDVSALEGHIAEAAMSVNAAIRRLGEARTNIDHALAELDGFPQIEAIRNYFSDLLYEIQCNAVDAQKGIQRMDTALRAAKIGGG